ncbi:UDPglucose--hexose-1-phosphate uridylyltransferase [Cellulosimicrobium sp. 4261]
MNPHLRRTSTRLADGRELVYFDDSPAYVSGERTRRLDDPRPLPDRFAPVPGPDGTPHPYVGPEMRRDPLTGDWVPLAAHRMNRTFLPAADSCPLCPARPGSAYSDGEVPDTDYDVVVFENRFPSLQRVPGVPDAVVTDAPLQQHAPAAGRCEVVCFSSDHRASFGALPPQRVRTIIDAWADRTAALGAEPGVEQVFCFENRGPEIGVTLHHPHGQIYGYPYVTPRTRALLDQAREHHRRTGRSLLRDVLESELADGRRVVLETEHWVAYVPYAARWPVEVHLAPRRDVPDLPALTDAERDDLASAYLELLRRLDRFFETADGDPIPLPYIAAWHQAPAREGRSVADGGTDDVTLARLHLQVFSVLRAPGKLKYLAGSESGMGAWISDTTPERIAARLQELAPASTARGWVPALSDDDGAARARAVLAEAFGADETGEEVRVWAAPGRVNLIGEHTDYNAGLCLPVALPHRTYVALRPRTDSLVRLASAQAPGETWTARLEDVGPGEVAGWGSYVAGVAWALREHLVAQGADPAAVPGFDAAVDSSVPFGAGLSSSAALECAVAVALDDVAGLGLAATDAGRAVLATASVRAENEIAGAPTGGMDQSAALRAQAGHALLLDCRPGLDPVESATQVPFDLDAAGLALLVVDTRAEHRLVDGQYAQRRATCEDAARTLGIASLRELADAVDASDDPVAALARALDALPDDVARRRVRHVVTEIGRVRELVALLREGRPDAVGPLLNASHASLRDDYEVSSVELDVAVDAARVAGALGARMTGGGFGGSAIALVRADQVETVADAVRAAFEREGLGAPGFLLATPSAPAERVA